MAEIKEKKMGRVFLVGAGPGDVRLITLKASELIKKSYKYHCFFKGFANSLLSQVSS